MTAAPVAGDPVWEHLTSVDLKRRLYARDPYFREALADARAVLGDRLYEVLQGFALLVVKPEGLVGRRTEALLAFLRETALTPVAFVPVRYTRHTVRALWHYQWNAATLEKMDLSERVNTPLPTTLALLRDDAAGRDVPATVRLKQLKGSATPEERVGLNVRDALRSPNRMITMVHTADEPADLVRELGIFFDRRERQALLASLLGATSADVSAAWAAELRRLEEQAPSNDFDAAAAWERVVTAADAGARPWLAAQRERYERTGGIDWWPFLARAEEAGADPWDVITIATTVVEHEDEGFEREITFEQADVDAWRSGKARLARREAA